MSKVAACLKEAVDEMSGRRDDPLSFVLKLASGRFKELPFSGNVLKKVRAAAKEAFDIPEAEMGVAEGQSTWLGM